MDDKLKHRSFQVSREKIDKDLRTLEFSAASEEPYARWDGVETLRIDESAIDFSRLKSAAPLLLGHDTRYQIGVVERAWIEDQKLRVSVRFSRSALGEEIMQDVIDGIRQNVSIGYQVITEERAKGDGNMPDQYTATSWQPMEVSIVPIPADNSVGVGRAVDISEEGMSKEASPVIEPKATTPAPATVAVVREEPPAATRDQETAEIRSLCKSAGFDDAKTAEFLKLSPKVEDARRLALDSFVRKHDEGVKTTVRMEEKDAPKYSLARAIGQMVRNQPIDGFEAEMSREIEKQTGRVASGLFVPREVICGLRRDMAATTYASGGAFVPTDVRPDQFIDLLRNNTVIDKLGIRRLTGLTANVDLPKQTGAGTAYWGEEAAEVTKSNQTTAAISLVPHRLSARTHYSKQFLLQSAIAAEPFVREDLMMQLAIEQDRACLMGSGANGEPLGIMNSAGINAGVTFGGAATWADILQFESDLEDDNALRGNLSFVVSPGTKNKWKSIARFANTDSVTLWSNDNTVNGYRTEATTQLVQAPASHKVIFGNFSDFILAEWDGLDITVDPFSLAANQQIRIILHMHCDTAVRRGESFSVSTDAGNQ